MEPNRVVGKPPPGVRKRSSRRASLSVSACVALLGCGADPAELPPYAEALIVVDTDALVPELVGRLRVDVYRADDGAWLESRAVARRSPTDWPASLSVYSTDEAHGRSVIVRLRAHGALAERDYRGERFAARPTSGAPGDPAPVAEPTDQPRLVQGGRDVTPPLEPDPNLTIDRLLRIRLEPGSRGSVHVVLSGACFGTMVDLAGRSTCTDTEAVRVPVEDARLEPTMTPAPSSLVGAFGAPEPCATAPRQAGTLADGTPLYDEEVCLPGGAFVLGSPEGVGVGLLDSAPERVARMPPLLVDRYEVTVGRFRAALGMGYQPAELPVPNPAPLAASSSDQHIRRCTWTDAPLSGAASRETYPLNCVSWTTARSFCQWLGGDFPTEAEWEYAAAAAGKGLETRYPWGADPPTCEGQVFSRLDETISLATECFDAGKPFGIAPMGADYAGDVTPLDVVGLGGGVSEWVEDAHLAYDTVCWGSAPLDDPRCIVEDAPTRTTRGASWAGTSVDVLAAVRGREGQIDTGYAEIGFRCARRGVAP